MNIADRPALYWELRRMLSDPPASPLTTAMLIDDIETKGPMYMRNLAEGRTALALIACTAV